MSMSIRSAWWNCVLSSYYSNSNLLVMVMRTLLLLLLFFNGARLQPTSCTEDSQCSSGFFCEESLHFCRECLRCDELKRESPQPRELCVKSVLQCGDCLKGLVADVLGNNDKLDIGCVSATGDVGAPHAYLPTYAWTAIAVGLLLMITMLGLFLKMKTFKVVAYSSRTSVQSLRAPGDPPTEPPPPPYNYHLPAARTFPPTTSSAGAAEMHSLVDSPKLLSKLSPARGGARAREAAGRQAARVCARPDYARLPQDPTRGNTPEDNMSSLQDSEPVSVIPTASDAVAQQTHVPNNNTIRLQDLPGNVTHCPTQQQSSQQDVPPHPSRSVAKEQDSNNNKASPEPRPGCAHVVSGASFVINVVENISSLHQRNHANFFRSPS